MKVVDFCAVSMPSIIHSIIIIIIITCVFTGGSGEETDLSKGALSQGQGG